MRCLLILFLLFISVPTQASDEAVNDEIHALQQRLEELERQVAKPPTSRGNEFNPRITAFGDFAGRLDNRAVTNDENREISNRMTLREFELDIRGDVDPYARAVAITSVSQESPNSNAKIVLEEVYATLSRMPRGTSLKAGKFKTGFGTLNRVHSHDLPQTTVPLPIIRFFGEDGITSEGLSFNYLMPLQNPGQSFDLTMEVFSAENPTLFSDTNPRGLAYLVRGKYFSELSDQDFFEIGSSLLMGRNALNANNVYNGKQTTYMWGGDFMYKWRALQPKSLRSVLTQGEFFYQNREDASLTNVNHLRRNAWGAYGLVQLQPAERWYVGSRYDWAQDVNNKYRIDRKIGGYVSFYTTEFLRFRLGYEYQNSAGPLVTTPQSPDRDLSTVYAQMTFVFGSHPAEPYWVSK